MPIKSSALSTQPTNFQKCLFTIFFPLKMSIQPEKLNLPLNQNFNLNGSFWPSLNRRFQSAKNAQSQWNSRLKIDRVRIPLPKSKKKKKNERNGTISSHSEKLLLDKIHASTNTWIIISYQIIFSNELLERMRGSQILEIIIYYNHEHAIIDWMVWVYSIRLSALLYRNKQFLHTGAENIGSDGAYAESE